MATGKKAERQARLDERAAAIQRKMDAERRTRNVIVAVFAVVLLGGGLGIYFLATYQPKSTASAKAAKAYSVPEEGFEHMPNCQPVYKHQPPSSGCHANVQGGVAPAAWQAYRTALPPEDWLHNLEHGGVALVYRCSGTECDTIYQQAFDLYAALPKEPKYNEVKFISTPYQNMTPKFALLAWTEELDMDTLDTNTVKDFYQQFVNHGREDLP